MNDTIDTKGANAGTKVKKLRINVTSAIIETAIPQDSSHCMIADAVKAAAVDKKMRISKVLVDLQSIRFTDRDTGRRYVCWTPLMGQHAIQQFDDGIKPEPFSFKLKPVQIIEKAHRAKPATATEPGKGPSKPRLVCRKDGSGPVKIGGKALAISAGLRRVFGIRQLGLRRALENEPHKAED